MTDDDWLAARFEDPPRPTCGRSPIGCSARSPRPTTPSRTPGSAASRGRCRPPSTTSAAWLYDVVARLGLDRLRPAIGRPTRMRGLEFPSSIVTPAGRRRRAAAANGVDPEHQALLADSVGLAMLVVLDTLSPGRAARLRPARHLRPAVRPDRPACRPLARGHPPARRRLAAAIRGAVPSTEPPLARAAARARRAFHAAARATATSRPSSTSSIQTRSSAPRPAPPASFGRSPPRPRRRGRRPPGPRLPPRSRRRPRRRSLTARPASWFAGDRPFAILAFTFPDDRIVELDILADPACLARIDLGGVLRRKASE